MKPSKVFSLVGFVSLFLILSNFCKSAVVRVCYTTAGFVHVYKNVKTCSIGMIFPFYTNAFFIKGKISQDLSSLGDCISGGAPL